MTASSKKRRVVVTGIGMVTPLGNTAEDTWKRILAGESGIAPIEHFDVSGFSVHFGGSVRDLNLESYLSPRESRKMDTFMRYGMVAGIQAMENSGLEISSRNAHRVGIIFGAGIGGLPGIENGALIQAREGPRRISPFYVPSNIINMIGGHLSIRYKAKGPNYALVSACTSGTHNIGHGVELIQWNKADAVLAGSAEMASSPTGLGGFASARALSTRNEEPEKASRPWDRARDGFVLSDGAGAVMLEEYESAKARGANILAEIIGYGANADAFHMTAPPEDGIGAANCMKAALMDADIAPSEIDYINAHATSTPAGDTAESLAVQQVFGPQPEKCPALSSTKSMIGHMLGASGAVELIFCILALRDQMAPPTINLDQPDKNCNLDYIPHKARAMKIDTCLSNSFGFGGTNGTLILRLPPQH
ncbi:MAG: beta-ketoacyl-ACP synthase II [Candidatus Eutrophobiaceae bacterium]